MVAPLAAAGARAMVRGAKKVTKTARRAEQPDRWRKAQARQRRVRRRSKPLSEAERQTQQKNFRQILPRAKRRKNKLKAKLGRPLNRQQLKAVAAVPTIIMVVISFVPAQMFVGVLCAVGMAIGLSADEKIIWSIFNMFVPGKTIFMVSLIIVLVIGFMSMLAAYLIFAMRGVHSLKNGGDLAFVLCLIGYVIPVFNIFPWVLVWVGYTVKNTK